MEFGCEPVCAYPYGWGSVWLVDETVRIFDTIELR